MSSESGKTEALSPCVVACFDVSSGEAKFSRYVGVAFSAEQARRLFEASPSVAEVICVSPPRSRSVAAIRDAAEFFDGEGWG